MRSSLAIDSQWLCHVEVLLGLLCVVPQGQGHVTAALGQGAVHGADGLHQSHGLVGRVREGNLRLGCGAPELLLTMAKKTLESPRVDAETPRNAMYKA